MTTLCNLLKITRKDAVEIGMTDLDINVIYSGLTYQAVSGYTQTNYSSNDKLSVNNADVEGILATVGVERDDIRAGLYDGAAPALAEVITASCEYDIPVHFDTDQLPQRFDALRSSDSEAVYYLPPLPIVEERI